MGTTIRNLAGKGGGPGPSKSGPDVVTSQQSINIYTSEFKICEEPAPLNLCLMLSIFCIATTLLLATNCEKEQDKAKQI